MDKPKILSGDEIVARGITKRDGVLPEAGLKEVFPNASWLEQKQIQSALEARKHLIEIERIEKSGVLSHADWREDLMLAEVTQKAGGVWQYLGHNVGKQLFLRPEEALFLMETNCLRLKYNGITVSLQQAYSLLLRSKVTILQYRVYSSLSRLGYKVYRYQERKTSELEKDMNLSSSNNSENGEILEDGDEKCDDGKETEDNMEVESGGDNCDISNAKECSKEDNNAEVSDTKIETAIEENVTVTDAVSSTDNIAPTPSTSKDSTNINEVEINPQASTEAMDTGDHNENIEGSKEVADTNNTELSSEVICIDSAELSKDIANQRIFTYNHKLRKLEKRQLRSCNAKHTEKSFGQMPDMTEDKIVTITVPDEQYIPRNVFLNNLNYALNLESIRMNTKDSRSASTESRTYSISEEVNGEHVRRIRDSALNNLLFNNWTPPIVNQRFSGPHIQFRPHFWRPNFNLGVPFNILLQRPFMINMNMNFMNKFRPFFRPPPLSPRFPVHQPNNQPETINTQSSSRKRRNEQGKNNHLVAIKQLALRLKHLIQMGTPQESNIVSLTNLIRTFNARYGSTLRLTDTFDIEEDNNLETISLDDDEETPSKKVRKDNDDFTENLNRLKHIALKLKHLESMDEASSRHRRALSNLLKKFNKSYNADIYMNGNFEVIDKRFINLDSSSDSDCVVQEIPKSSSKKTKKLKNPFNIIKRLSEKQNTSFTQNESVSICSRKYEELKRIFGGHWLPPEDDFGKPEVVQGNLGNTLLFDSKQDEFLFEFMKSEPYNFSNWLDLKIAFLKSVEETNAMMVNQAHCSVSMPEINSIIQPEDCVDTASVLKKLSIIRTNKDINVESNLSVDFDVYNRDVQNFRKSNRPKPHFRVICVSESSSFPAGKDVACLQSKYRDNVAIVFAVVGLGSIMYLQINPIELPIYIPNSDLIT